MTVSAKFYQWEKKRKTQDKKKHQPPDSPFYCTQNLYLLSILNHFMFHQIS